MMNFRNIMPVLGVYTTPKQVVISEGYRLSCCLSKSYPLYCQSGTSIKRRIHKFTCQMISFINNFNHHFVNSTP